MFYRVIEKLKTFVLYTRPERTSAIVICVFRHTEPSPFVRGGILRLHVKGQTVDVPMSRVAGYHQDMAVPVEVVRERTTDEVFVLDVGAPCDS